MYAKSYLIKLHGTKVAKTVIFLLQKKKEKTAKCMSVRYDGSLQQTANACLLS